MTSVNQDSEQAPPNDQDTRKRRGKRRSKDEGPRQQAGVTFVAHYADEDGPELAGVFGDILEMFYEALNRKVPMSHEQFFQLWELHWDKMYGAYSRWLGGEP